MNYGEIKFNDIANGEGIRVTLFVSGCRNKCKGCFNEATWDFNYGKPYNEEVENKIIEALAPGYVSGLSVLGGEPFEPENQETVSKLIKKVRALYPNKNIWVYSGYVLDKEIMPFNGKVHTKYTDDILNNIDVLVDGRFVCELKNLMLKFRGSSNQRIILMKETLKTGEIVLSELNKN